MGRTPVVVCIVVVCIALVSAACASSVRPPVGVTVIVDGPDAAGARAAMGRRTVDGLILRPVAPPRPPPAPPDPAAQAVAAARTHYYADVPSFAACKSALDPIEVPALLGLGRRDLASRVLVWRAACAWATDRAGAGVIAAQLASYGLELPPDVGAVTPDVEAMLARAIAAIGRAPRLPIAVDGPGGARVLLDGRPADCNVPCTTDAVPGDHVVSALGDGLAPTWQVARVPAEGPVTLVATPASPDQAAAQWRARIDVGLPRADDVGARLVARAVGDARVAYLVIGGRTASGVFVIDGAVVARITRADRDALGLVRDLAIRGKLLPAPPLYKQPRFWVAAVVITGLATAVTAAIVYQPGTKTEVGF